MLRHIFFLFFRYEIMHTCWSPVPKCRPSFQQLVEQLEMLRLTLDPSPPLKERLLYVNLEGDAAEDGGCGAGMGSSDWSVPWQRPLEEGEEPDEQWLMGGSGPAVVVGGDYRYIMGPCGAPAEDEGTGGDEEDVINV